ncbi:GNAT family N-acetyltransferase [Glycomyces harbinensis]|uniref:Predicted acetyltransferase, GNAT family n=1 Tax=Glycomyces harbinensis TaxID=58114 RepID=A0A1G6R8V4_9ACTN|nr:GNAT family N-acetyltransferase [Glycomyces harbinensis]SDD00968.1 Predicted acetyltransferase, GNAT family [Glycomyces harbinensis]
MPDIHVRPFRRSDREQLTDLVNAHVRAVVPGLSVPVNTVLSALEREAGEFITDPWVTDRVSLVAEQRARVVAAAHLLRYGAGEEVGDFYRDAGEIRWLVHWPAASYWPDSALAAEALIAACLAQMRRWGVSRRYADGSLPAPGVYGVPQQWPHIRGLYERAGFADQGRTEVLLLAAVDEIPTPGTAPLETLRLRRTLGVNGTRLAAWLGDEEIGWIEVDTGLAEAGRLVRLGGWADVGNLEVDQAYRRRGVATWLVGQAAEWLRLGRIDRLLGYATPDEKDGLEFLHRVGFRELTRTSRDWIHLADS